VGPVRAADSSVRRDTVIHKLNYVHTEKNILFRLYQSKESTRAGRKAVSLVSCSRLGLPGRRLAHGGPSLLKSQCRQHPGSDRQVIAYDSEMEAFCFAFFKCVNRK